MFLTLLVVLLLVWLVELRPQRLADAGRAVGEILHDPRRRAAVPTHLKWEMYQCNDRAICMNILWGNGIVVMGSGNRGYIFYYFFCPCFIPKGDKLTIEFEKLRDSLT